MAEPIKQVTLTEYKTEDISVHLVAKINDAGELVLEGYDIGKDVKEYWGDSDYEYWLVVKREWKDTVLLRLIKDRFTSDSDFKQWLESKTIPSAFNSWV